MTLRDPSIECGDRPRPAFRECGFEQVRKRRAGLECDPPPLCSGCVGAPGFRYVLFGMHLALLLLSWATSVSASSQELTATQALELLRENFRFRDEQPGFEVSRASALESPSTSGPTLSVSIEGAGRTDLYGIEQEIPLFRNDKLFRRAGERAMAAQEADARHRDRQTEARMLKAFYRLIQAQERKQAIGQGIVELEAVVHSLQEIHGSERQPGLDLIPAQHALAELQIAEAEAEIAAMESRSLLGGLLGEPIDPDKLHASGSLEPAYELPSLQESLVEALATRMDFQAAAARLEQADIETAAASDWRLSNPRLLGGIKRADLGDRYAVGPYFAVSIPIPMPGRRQKLKLAASQEESLRRRHLNSLRRGILAQVRAAHHALRIRRKTVENYRSELPGRTAEKQRDLLKAYRSGEMKPVDLLGSIRMRREASLRLIDLRAASKIAEVEFDRISGGKAH